MICMCTLYKSDFLKIELNWTDRLNDWSKLGCDYILISDHLSFVSSEFCTRNHLHFDVMAPRWIQSFNLVFLIGQDTDADHMILMSI